MEAALKRLWSSCNEWRAIYSLKTLISPSSRDLQHRLYQRSFENQMQLNTLKGLNSKPVSEFTWSFSMMPALLTGLLGVGMIEMSYADASEVDPRAPASPDSPSSSLEEAEKIVRQERNRLEECLKRKEMQYGSYPPFSVSMKGQKVRIKFQIPSTCDSSHLIVDLASHLGLKVEERGDGGSDMILRAWNSAVAWQLMLDHLQKQKQIPSDGALTEDKNKHDEHLCVLIFQSLISPDNAEIEFIKQGSFSPKELDALASALKLAGGKMGVKRAAEKRSRGYPERRQNKPDAQVPAEKSLTALEEMGVRVFGLSETFSGSSNSDISWENIAGYDHQKREIEDTILLALRSPEVYDNVARGTRRKFESNRPRAVLFEGPPGTGKTSCARVIANQAGVPLLYVPLEVVMSKYYGESERLLGTVFSLANELPNGALLFLDEVDSFAASRDEGMHEATRRILSVLLRQIDGFEQDKRVVVIAATNRKEDLDPALISRFDSMITFNLPDQQTRGEIAAQYAKHLNKNELIEFAAATEGMSGRDIRDVCQQTERRWASKIIRGQTSSDTEQGHLPPIEEYIESALNRQKALCNISDKRSQKPNLTSHKSLIDFL